MYKIGKQQGPTVQPQGTTFHILAITYKNQKKNMWGFPGGPDGKESAYSAGVQSSNSGLGRSPGEGNGNPL